MNTNGPRRNMRRNIPVSSGLLEPYYSANIYRYKCVGHLKLSSEDIGSRGVCRGLQFQTELVAKMPPGTREQTIKRFLDANAEYDDGEDASATAADQKVKEIYTSRTLIYREEDENNKKNKKMVVKKKTLPEEELIGKTEWSCYGSTNVHYLVLKEPPSPQTTAPPGYHDIVAAVAGGDNLKDKTRPSKKMSETGDSQTVPPTASSSFTTAAATAAAAAVKKSGKIAAITPDNLGVAVRKIDSQVGHFTMIDLGSIRICLETPSSSLDDDNTPMEETSQQQMTQQQKQQQKQQQTIEQQSSTTSDTPQKKMSNNNNNENNKLQKKPPPTIQDSVMKVYNFSWKIIDHMKQNKRMLQEAVSDDFPNRTIVFGNKIITRFNKTADQTIEFMGKIIDSWRR